MVVWEAPVGLRPKKLSKNNSSACSNRKLVNWEKNLCARSLVGSLSRARVVVHIVVVHMIINAPIELRAFYPLSSACIVF